MTRRRAILSILAAAFAAIGLYLLAWPIVLDPVAWEAPQAPEVVPNAKLANLRRIAGELSGPEALAVDRAGRLYAGTVDGKVARFSSDGSGVEILTETGGRPLGLKIDEDGRVIVADAQKGLLSIEAGAVTVLADSYEGRRMRFPDDVALGPDGTVYFTDASQRFGIEDKGAEADILEHRETGRVFGYRPETRDLSVVVDGLQFANGVAVSLDGSFLLINETGRYRVLRHWLTGPKAGSTEPFAENLPGFPDNVTAGPSGLFWVALYSPRVPVVDSLAAHPFWRKVAWRLPAAVRPKPIRKAFVLALDGDGRIVHDLQDDAPEAYAPVTSALEHDGMLYLGSLVRQGVAVVPVPLS